MNAGSADGVFFALSNARLGFVVQVRGILLTQPWHYLPPKPSHKGSHKTSRLLRPGRESHWEGRLI